MPIILMSGGNAMKKPYTSFVTGLLVGVALFSGTTAYAAGIMAERSTNRIFVDGKEVQVEAYTIHNNNFMQLRDVGKAVGFNVYWDSDNGCVQVESGKPYTGTAPQQTAAAPTDGSRYVPKVGDVIRCDDGTDYTITDVSRWDSNAFPAHRWESCPPPPVTGASCPSRKCREQRRVISQAAGRTTCSNAISTKHAGCSIPCIMPSGTTPKHGRTASR